MTELSLTPMRNVLTGDVIGYEGESQERQIYLCMRYNCCVLRDIKTGELLRYYAAGQDYYDSESLRLIIQTDYKIVLK